MIQTTAMYYLDSLIQSFDLNSEIPIQRVELETLRMMLIAEKQSEEIANQPL
ncbi:hypothetical protein SmaMPs15_000078 [Stenotrophomonas maltophilia phage vB_SmaM_Ps15]|uniref:Uncharacterized protein n=1 Tax=Stenotrophomonas maltophilia phage vB_SmaM_Ps15 TaxID=3071007 RepID=A0AAE9FLI6_9CAUD|nr:hypothetical protein PQC01_gp078 [Stenotrophomonas maltophilia phage vB_SmaM_Ps15]UMO77229.1 hypothetical protein SmaMPs15_000078 [Stenotrophomonas maltophilia phage vB_SmaM_Ps15]